MSEGRASAGAVGGRGVPGTRLLAGGLWFAIVMAVVAATFGLQNGRVGFEPGHHGWVTSHHLAIIQRSTLSNWGVGYTADVIDEDGKREYWYFNRAPFLFEAAVHAVLRPVQDDLAAYVHGARQIFNGVFLLTLLVAFAIARLWLASGSRALIATFMLGTGYYLLEYKDLVEPARPGTLATLLVVYAIAEYERGGRTRRLWSWTAIAACMGEGAPACFMLLAWCFVAAVRGLRARCGWKAVRHAAPPRALALAVAITAFFIGYSVWSEARIRSVSPAETTIVGSALRRLGGADQKYGAGLREMLAWENYPTDQASRLLRGFAPHVFPGKRDATRDVRARAAALPFLVLAALVCFAFLRWRWKGTGRDAPLVAIGGLVLYLVVMRRMVAFHEFSLVLATGFYLVVWCGLVCWLPRRSPVVLAAVAGAFLFYNLVELREHHNRSVEPHDRTTADFQAIRAALGSEPKRIFLPGKLRKFVVGAPYAPFF